MLDDPNLILADIQLADGSSGLDAVNELLRTFQVPGQGWGITHNGTRTCVRVCGSANV